MSETSVPQLPFLGGCLLIVGGIGMTVASAESLFAWAVFALGVGLLLATTLPAARQRLAEV